MLGRFFRITSLVLAIFILLVLPNHVSASEMSPRYTNVSYITADIDIANVSGIATCTASVVAKDQVSNIRLIATLYRLVDGEWQSVKNWTTSNIGTATIVGYCAISKGNTYKLCAFGYVYDANGNLLESVESSESCIYI